MNKRLMQVNVRRMLVAALLLLAVLALPAVALAQGEGESLPENIVDFFSIDSLAIVLGAVASFIIYWLDKMGIEGTAQKVVLVVGQGLIAVAVVAVSGLVPNETLTQYNTLYIALRAFFMAILGNQGAYRANEIARAMPNWLNGTALVEVPVGVEVDAERDGVDDRYGTRQ